MGDYSSKTAELLKRALETKFEFKLASLHDLYRTVSMQFEGSYFSGLYFVNAENDIRILIPNTNESLRDFIINHQGVLRPVYPIPAAVVYKVFMADACGHEQEKEKEKEEKGKEQEQVEVDKNNKNKIIEEPENEIISINSQIGSTITLKIHIS